LGKNVDLAQFESSVGTIGPLLMASAVNGEPPARLGNRSTSAAPQGCYPCAGKDEWCTVSVQTNEQWQALTSVIGKPALANDPRFATMVGRLRGQDEIDTLIAAWSAGLPPLEVEQRRQRAGVPAARMRRAGEILGADDAGRVFAMLDTSIGKPTAVATLPYAFSESVQRDPEPVPPLGAHTRSVLEGWLGLSAAEIDQLEAEEALT
jgi:crotonobetainyl-CoA:carnitine CoA-transferase CaiB-like acyl-CoA transferase